MNNKKENFNNDVVKVDSTKVDLFTKEKKGAFITKNPKPLKPITRDTVFVSDSTRYKKLLNTLKLKYNRSVDSVTLLKELLEAKKVREYKERYEDSLIVADLYEKVEGKLLERKFNYKLKPQKVTYYNKTTTIEKYPDYAFFLGLSFLSDNNFSNNSFGLDLSYQNKQGDIISLGYTTTNAFYLGYKRRLFVKY